MKKHLVTTAMAVLLSAAAASTASAQDGFAIQHFNPAANQANNGFVLQGAETLEHLQFSGGLLANYADAPLVFRNKLDGEIIRKVIENQLVTDVHAALGLFGVVELGLVMPVIWLQQGASISNLPNSFDDVGIGVGDLRIVPKITLFNTASNKDTRKGVGLALLADFYVPTGDTAAYQGGEFRAEP